MAGLHFSKLICKESVMKYKNTAMLLLGTLALSLSATGFAATDTIDAASGQAGTYFTPSLAQRTSNPYYRSAGEDWEWQHNAIAGSFTTATLNISAYDVDNPSANPSFDDEIDEIYGWNNQLSGWSLLGVLDGANNIFSFTEFTLDNSWFDEIALGLKVMMKIDENNEGWAVSLSKSVLSLDGGAIGNPNPGQVPVPAALFMFAPALLGFFGLRRKVNKAA
jgi:hypothetical protein